MHQTYHGFRKAVPAADQIIYNTVQLWHHNATATWAKSYFERQEAFSDDSVVIVLKVEGGNRFECAGPRAPPALDTLGLHYLRRLRKNDSFLGCPGNAKKSIWTHTCNFKWHLCDSHVYTLYVTEQRDSNVLILLQITFTLFCFVASITYQVTSESSHVENDDGRLDINVGNLWSQRWEKCQLHRACSRVNEGSRCAKYTPTVLRATAPVQTKSFAQVSAKIMKQN